MTPAVLPYGSWPSPITTDLLVEKVVGLAQLRVDGDDLYWLERRPAEAGRQVVVRHGAGDAIPSSSSARTLVHEYGGGDYTVAGGRVIFSDFASQRIFVGDAALTPDDGTRYADYDVHPDGASVACVRERHLDGGEVLNDVVVVSFADASVRVIAEGHDFFSAPRWSPDGRVAWLAWDHPNMPWDGTTLYVDGTAVTGGESESISQPRWSPDGVLHWVSDRTGWWNIYDEHGALALVEAEFSGPDWGFAFHTYDWLPDGRLVTVIIGAGHEELAVLQDGTWRAIDVPFGEMPDVRIWRDRIVLIGASPTAASVIATVDPDTGAVDVIRRAREATVDPRFISVAQPIEFPTGGGLAAHALYYPPTNPDAVGPEGELPPLVVMSHGGPTSSASPSLNLDRQFFTSRGIAVVDVDYGGSAGYGREYRERLEGQWGVVDVEDCANAALWLASQGFVDGSRLAIRGGSAGGYTTLCALTFRDDFAVGASYYGVADAEALATDTHKFESRYLDRLIGPYPEARDLYRQRSPIHFASQLTAPVILLQGLDDKVVPPSQAEVMVDALKANGVMHEYVPFEGEQHGFRKAETIKAAAEAELRFYGRVLGFSPSV
jgi:dipeptidyl aminopeptidase/acylaminoacyl peptidase